MFEKFHLATQNLLSSSGWSYLSNLEGGMLQIEINGDVFIIPLYLC